MKRGYLIGLLICTLVSTGLLSATKMPCNERMRHGQEGLAKAVLTLACGVGSVYVGKKYLWEEVGTLWNLLNVLPEDATFPSKKQNTFTNVCFTGCTCAVLGYFTWKLGKSSIESLAIYLDDDMESIDTDADVDHISEDE